MCSVHIIFQGRRWCTLQGTVCLTEVPLFLHMFSNGPGGLSEVAIACNHACSQCKTRCRKTGCRYSLS
jgi:hypothetical protein